MSEAAIFLAGIGILFLVWFLLGRRARRSLKRLNRYILIPSARADGKADRENLYQALDRKMDRVPVMKTLFIHIERRLTMADLPVKTSEFLIAILILMVTALAAHMMLAGGYHYTSPLAPAGVLILSFAFLNLYIRIRIGRIRKQLKLAISLLANQLKTGHSFVQALRQVAQDLDPPLKGEFELLLNENRLGIPLDAALNNMLRRVPCKELRTLVRGVILQQQTGSNLVFILKTIGQALQDRDDLRSKINVLTAQGKLSGVLCVSIPFFIFWVMHRGQPEYTNLLLHTDTGHRLLLACAFMVFLGSILIFRIVRFRF